MRADVNQTSSLTGFRERLAEALRDGLEHESASVDDLGENVRN